MQNNKSFEMNGVTIHPLSCSICQQTALQQPRLTHAPFNQQGDKGGPVQYLTLTPKPNASFLPHSHNRTPYAQPPSTQPTMYLTLMIPVLFSALTTAYLIVRYIPQPTTH